MDAVLLGGGMANTFLLAEGKAVGDSLVEADLVDTASTIIASARDKGVDLLLPVDVVAAPGLDGQAATIDADGIRTVGQHSISDRGQRKTFRM
ncbi:MAG: phosphoglycerate kinase [Thermomicrobiales bacterium]